MAVDAARAKSLFLAASDLADPAARAAYLDRECGGDADLRGRVEALLRADAPAPADATGAFAPDPPPVPAGRTADEPGRDEPVGAVLAGKYRLAERIGEGGMGSVWVAHQSEPVKRKVAVKLIKAGMDSKNVLARFEAERQALAVMDHPNIAKVLDGGLHDSRPFFVMELVKGVPITEYCDARKLTPKERLELFVPVCQAIQHAHQKGIIHRDIKPSNVLIALYDDKPVPKVIDFGIAKATGGTLTERTIETAFGGVVGTPQYMSPEQASLNNLDIDTRSDVYSLGVLLYELLTGSPPFAPNELEKRGLLEILRVVREEEPPRPSMKLSTADALPSLAASRGTEPKKLTGLLRNELDWIVMKALEKDRTRRYATANGFAADVNRYLSGEAVSAHPPSTAYRVKKFVRRNRGQVIAASLVLFALLAGLATASYGFYRADIQRQRAEGAERSAVENALKAMDAAEAERKAREREADERKKADAAKVEAEAREADAKAVLAFFETKVFRAAGPKGQDGGLGKDVTLRNAIVSSLPTIEQGFTDKPHVEALLRHVLGTTFHNLGEHDKALEQRTRALALNTRMVGPDHANTLRCKNNLANTYAALNRRAEALKLQEEVVAARKRVLPPDHPDTLKALGNLARSYSALGRHPEAVKLKEQVLATMRRVLPPDDPETLAGMSSLAASYSVLNRREEAIELYEQSVAAQKRVLPKDHPDTMTSMHNLANNYFALNRRAEGLKLHEEVLAAQRRVLPANHPGLHHTIHDLAISYAMLNRHAKAVELYEEALAGQRKALSNGHPDTLRTMHNLAVSYSTLKRHAEAVKLNEEALILRRPTPDNVDTLSCMHSLAIDYTALNRHAEALKLREEVLAARKRLFPKDHPSTILSMWALAESLFALGRSGEAVPLLDECIAKAAGTAVQPEMPMVVGMRLEHFRKTGDPAGCRATAEMWEKLNRTDADSLYNAARFRAVTAGVQPKTPGADSARLAKDDADRAMQWLHQAVQAGYRAPAHMRKDTDLAPLRDREDFQKLLAELEAKFPPPPELAPPSREKK